MYAHERTVSALQRKVAQLELELELVRYRGEMAVHQHLSTLQDEEQLIDLDTPSNSNSSSRCIIRSSPEHAQSSTNTTIVTWEELDALIRRPIVQRHTHIQVFGNMDMESSIRAAGYSEDVQNIQVMNFHVPEHMITPLWYEEEAAEGNLDWFSRNFNDHRKRSRRLVEQSTTTPDDIIGPDFPSLETIMKTPPLPPEGAQTLSDWVSRMMGHWTHLELVDRIASWLIVFLLMRASAAQSFAAIDVLTAELQWQIYPTK